MPYHCKASVIFFFLTIANDFDSVTHCSPLENIKLLQGSGGPDLHTLE